MDKIRSLLAVSVASLTFLFKMLWPHLPPADPDTYFAFADDRIWIGIPNAMDVLSNFAFLVVGIFGLIYLREAAHSWPRTHVKIGYVLAIANIFLCFGSGYFHYNPGHESLVWDRLPMTIGFAAICALVIADRMKKSWGLIALALVSLAGLFSVIGYAQSWITLRPYISLQFGTLLFVALNLMFFRPGRIPTSVWGASLGLYVLAKIFELADAAVFEFTGVISGHTIKHLLAALAIFCVLRAFRSYDCKIYSD